MATTVARDVLMKEIGSMLAKDGDSDAAMEAVLAKLLQTFECVVGTIHTIDPASGLLKLRARRGIPDHILDRVRMIPIGKGMAGIAAERKQPVQMCNLQTDASGIAKPSAKDTKVEGSIAAPMLAGGILKGTVGVAKPVPYEFSDEESDLLLDAGALIAAHLK